MLQAQYDFEGAYPPNKAACRNSYYRLIDHYLEKYNASARATGQSQITRLELIEALGEPYREFKRQRDLEAVQKLRHIR